MTALSEYARLECTGLWRAAPDAQRRDVIVCFGEATLAIFDSSGRALAHWSLPAVERLNPGTRPAIFAPDAGDDETLEIAEDEMIEAIERVRRSLVRTRPRPGRVRVAAMVLSVAAVAALGFLWFPAALRSQTQIAVPAVKRSEIGATILGHIQRMTGPACRSPPGLEALAALAGRTFGPDSGGRIVVLPTDALQSLYLPGGIVLLGRGVVEDHDDPAVAAGHILAAAAEVQVRDPLEPALRAAGVAATFRLYTTGRLAPESLAGHAEALLAAPPPPPDAATLLPLFGAAQVPATPYAGSLRAVAGAPPPGAAALIEADPMAGRETPPILGDAEWIGLQGICDG